MVPRDTAIVKASQNLTL